MIITHEGQRYEITNWDDFSHKLLNGIKIQLEDEITKKIGEIGLVDTGKFKQNVSKLGSSKIEGNELIMTNAMPYAVYLEYGAPGTEKGVVDPFGESSRGANPSRKMPPIDSLKSWAKKHGNINPYALAKHIQRKGTEAYAPYRRVLYNKELMARIINKAFRLAGG